MRQGRRDRKRFLSFFSSAADAADALVVHLFLLFLGHHRFLRTPLHRRRHHPLHLRGKGPQRRVVYRRRGRQPDAKPPPDGVAELDGAERVEEARGHQRRVGRDGDGSRRRGGGVAEHRGDDFGHLHEDRGKFFL